MSEPNWDVLIERWNNFMLQTEIYRLDLCKKIDRIEKKVDSRQLAYVWTVLSLMLAALIGEWITRK